MNLLYHFLYTYLFFCLELISAQSECWMAIRRILKFKLRVSCLKLKLSTNVNFSHFCQSKNILTVLSRIVSGFSTINLYHSIHAVQVKASEMNKWTWIFILVQRNDLQIKFHRISITFEIVFLIFYAGLPKAQEYDKRND